MRSLFILTVLVLFLYITLSESCDSPTASLLGKRFRFESKNFKNHYFRHRGYQMWKDGYSSSGLYQLDSSFDIVPGLAGVGVSFRSVNYPNYFIRHYRYKCYIHRSDGKQLFRNEATFIPRVGLADPRGVSFESVNLPGFFIRHRSSRVQINRIDGSRLFRLDATWFPRLVKSVKVYSKWLLVEGSSSPRHVSFKKMEGLQVGNRYSTSYGINTENSWKDAIQRGNFASIGCSIKAMFKRFKFARVTGDSSWTRLSYRGYNYISISKPTYIWQLYLYGLTSEGTLIISKTNIYVKSTSNLSYLSSQTDSDEKSSEDDVNDNVKEIEDTGPEKNEQNIDQLISDKNSESVSPVGDEPQVVEELQDINQHHDDSDEPTTVDMLDGTPNKDDISDKIPTLESDFSQFKEEIETNEQ